MTHKKEATPVYVRFLCLVVFSCSDVGWYDLFTEAAKKFKWSGMVFTKGRCVCSVRQNDMVNVQRIRRLL